MKTKYILSSLILFSLSFLFLVNVYAADFALTRIGALDTGGAMYSDWWYTGVNPTLSGTGEADATITVTVADSSFETTVDGDGNWSIALSLAAGDYAVQLSESAGGSYSFNLHLGQALPADLGSTSEASESTGTVPQTGFNQIIGITMSVGVLLLGFYLYVWGNPKVQAAIEKRLIKD
jgi:hypothetical protein